MVDQIDFSQVPKDHRGYDSSFDSDVEKHEKRESFHGLLKEKKKREKVGEKRQLEEELIKEEGKIYRAKAVSMNAYSRHKQYINNYLLYYGGSKKDVQRDRSKDRTDLDVIRENHQFLWDDEPDETNWEKRLAKKYFDKLFKEYCIADLSRYKENKVGMRWRVEKEVVDGKGQFMCGNKKCTESEGLRSWEVNFGYIEHGEKKNALVKLRLCPDCSYKLNYHHKRKEVLPKPKVSESSSKSHRSKEKKRRSHDPGSSNDEKRRQESKDEEKKDTTKEEKTEDGIWSKPVKLVEEKSREDEFDDYFADMFL